MKPKLSDKEIEAAVKVHLERVFPDVIKDEDLNIGLLPPLNSSVSDILAFGRTIDKSGDNPDFKKLILLVKPLWDKYNQDRSVSDDVHVLRFILYAEAARSRFGFLNKSDLGIWEDYIRDVNMKIRKCVEQNNPK